MELEVDRLAAELATIGVVDFDVEALAIDDAYLAELVGEDDSPAPSADALRHAELDALRLKAQLLELEAVRRERLVMAVEDVRADARTAVAFIGGHLRSLGPRLASLLASERCPAERVRALVDTEIAAIMGVLHGSRFVGR